MALLSPGSSPVSENHLNAPGSAGKEALKLFSHFSRLPRELRQEVWFMALESSEPRVYTFVLEREQQGYRAPITEVSLRPLPLRPGLFWERDWRGFIAATATRRSVSTACRESRDCVLYLLPDSIQFKGPLSGTIHFSGMRDIITISGLSPRIMRDVIDWIRDTGPFRPFRNIRHLAFESETLAEYSTWREAGPFCYCESPECGFCMLEPLPGFLACFPKLETLHLAVLSERWTQPGMRDALHPLDPVPRCACPVTGGEYQAGGTHITPHAWPLVRATSGDWPWFISYPERGGCPFPQLPHLNFVRQKWLPGWPYYKSLEHIDIRILRRVETDEADYELVYCECGSPVCRESNLRSMGEET